MITLPIIFFVFWALLDTVTDSMCEGKPFVPNELKGFR
jgi:hypothetical protein